jgi:hypothetical protein
MSRSCRAPTRRPKRSRKPALVCRRRSSSSSTPIASWLRNGSATGTSFASLSASPREAGRAPSPPGSARVSAAQGGRPALHLGESSRRQGHICPAAPRDQRLPRTSAAISTSRSPDARLRANDYVAGLPLRGDRCRPTHLPRRHLAAAPFAVRPASHALRRYGPRSGVQSLHDVHLVPNPSTLTHG